jgi:hypothetical protein
MQGTATFSLTSPPFPTPAQLEALSSTPVPPRPEHLATALVDQWSLAAPFPMTFGEMLPPGDDSQEILDAMFRDAGSRAVRTTAMRCIATEEARFRVHHRLRAPAGLEDLFRERCGVTGSQLENELDFIPVSPEVPEAEVRALLLRNAVQRSAQMLPVGEVREVGAAFVRDNGVAMLVVAAAKPRVYFALSSRVPDAAGRVDLSGRLEQPLASIQAWITRGPLGVRPCEVDQRVQLPMFHVTCLVDPSERVATIGLWGRPPGALMTGSLFAVAVGAPDAVPTAFNRPPAQSSPHTSEQYRAELLALLNEARARAGVPGVALAEEQSRSLCALAPLFVASSLGLIPTSYEDTIGLGYLAGWRVEEPIVDAGIYSHVSDSADARQSFDEQLMRPTARWVLLDRRWDRVALCPVLSSAGGLEAVLWSGYDVLRPDERAHEATALIERINETRAAVQYPPILIDEQIAGSCDRAVVRMMEGQVDSRHAMGEAFYDVRMGTSPGAFITVGRGDPLRGWWAIGQTLPSMRLPDELVFGPPSPMAASVAYMRLPGSNWATRVALLVAIRPRGN